MGGLYCDPNFSLRGFIRGRIISFVTRGYGWIRIDSNGVARRWWQGLVGYG
jgi:hypothetical protein